MLILIQHSLKFQLLRFYKSRTVEVVSSTVQLWYIICHMCNENYIYICDMTTVSKVGIKDHIPQ